MQPDNLELFYVQFLPDFMGADFFKLPEMQAVGKLMAAGGGVTFSGAVCAEVVSLLGKIPVLNSSKCLLSLLDILDRLSRDLRPFAPLQPQTPKSEAAEGIARSTDSKAGCGLIFIFHMS